VTAHAADVLGAAIREANLASERRRVRGDVIATRWLCFAPDCTLDTITKIEAELKYYRQGDITGDAALAGIAEALALNARFGEPVECRAARAAEARSSGIDSD
jgi:hypothetical protein